MLGVPHFSRSSLAFLSLHGKPASALEDTCVTKACVKHRHPSAHSTAWMSMGIPSKLFIETARKAVLKRGYR
jgi:hypothetical protein